MTCSVLQRYGGAAVLAMPDVDLKRFPVGREFVAEVLQTGEEEMVEYLVCLKQKMLDWQRSICMIPDAAVSVDMARVFLFSKRVHFRSAMAVCALESDTCGLVAKENFFLEAVAMGEGNRGWASQFLSVELRESMASVMAERDLYDITEAREERAAAAELVMEAVCAGPTTAAILASSHGSMFDRVASFESANIVVVGSGNAVLGDSVKGVVSRDKLLVAFPVYTAVVTGAVRFDEEGFLQMKGSDELFGLSDQGGTVCTSEAYYVRFPSSGLVISVTDLRTAYQYIRILPGIVGTNGYCYLRTFPPLSRFAARAFLGAAPLASACREYAERLGIGQWCNAVASVVRSSGTDLGTWHVVSDGLMPDFVRDGERVAGDPKPRDDPFVRNLLARTFSHEPAERGAQGVAHGVDVSTLDGSASRFSGSLETVPRSVRKSMGLSVLTTAQSRRSSATSNEYVHSREPSVQEVRSPDMQNVSMETLATEFFSNLGLTCQRKPARSVAFAGTDDVIGVASAEWVGISEMKRDTERARALEARLQSGPVISQAYCKVLARRHDDGKARPKEGDARGRAIAVGDMFAPRTVATPIGWTLDKTVPLPGWTTYLLRLRSGEVDVVLTSPVSGARDVRLDWSGIDSSVVVGESLQFPCDGTVLWFTRAVSVRVKAVKEVIVRCSVPVSGHASALGWDVRRYGMLHDTVAIRDFGLLRPPDYISVKLKPRWRGSTGVACYYARAVVDASGTEVGVNFNLREGGYLQSVIEANQGIPAMVGIRATIPGSLSRVVVSGTTLHPNADGKVLLVSADWMSGVSVMVTGFTTLKFSLLFIVDPYSFESRYAGRNLETPTSA